MKTDISLSSGSFGVVIDYPKPNDADVVIVCGLGNGGIKPLQVKLPHQVYEKDVQEIMKEYGEVVLIPCKASDYVRITQESLVKAKKKAEEMRVKAINALQKKIKKLEKMEF